MKPLVQSACPQFPKSFKLLSDGDFDSAAAVTDTLRLSHAVVCRTINVLKRLELGIKRVSARRNRSQAVFRPLDRYSILDYLGADASSVADRLFVHSEVDSTNLWLRRQAIETRLPSGTVCVTGTQTAGRGQRGRSWVATPGSNIALSVAWRFQATAATITGLSLAAGVAVVRALHDYGVSGLGLKWPNDVVWNEKKLAGVLVESYGEAGGTTMVIVGVGVNAYLAEREAAFIEQPWVDLTRIVGQGVDRNRVIALLIRGLNQMLRTFETSGFESFRRDWERCHIFTGRWVRLRQRELTISGRVLGVDSGGALRVMDEHGDLRVFNWGEVSLRPDA